MTTVKKDERTYWHTEATRLLRDVLYLNRVSYKELSRMLAALGENEPPKTLSNKVNRGSFSFQFFLKCLVALGKSELRLEMKDLSERDKAEIRSQAAKQDRRHFPRVRHVKVPTKANRSR